MVFGFHENLSVFLFDFVFYYHVIDFNSNNKLLYRVFFQKKLQEYGGGGHQSASYFMLGSAEFDKWKV